MTRIWALCALMALAAGCGDDGGGEGAPAQDAAGDEATQDAALDGDDGGAADTAADLEPDLEPDLAPDPCSQVATSVVTFTTDDGITLEADLHTVATSGSPAVVLLHMIPPGNDRTNYPPAFRDLLAGRGFTVLNVDRRGAGASGGTALEAYEGPQGKLDAKAAVDFLGSLPCPVDLTRLVVVGASNGTTTAVDYTVWAAGEEGSADPAALVFLTGGAYTENQNTLSDHMGFLGALPVLFVYSTAESTWPETYLAGAPATWTFSEYPGPGHGTHLFAAEAALMEDVAGWIEGATSP